MRKTMVWAMLVLAAAAAPAGGQEGPDLDRVEELTSGGRAEDARGLLLRWWEEVRPRASRRDVQRGLWLRARLTVDPVQADLDYRRLAIEYPGGPYSDRALLRLAQSAQARGELEAAANALRRLRTEYPSSSVLGDAEEWLSAVGPLPEPSATQAAPPAGPPPGPAEQPPAPPRTFAVQVGAFSQPDRARTVLEALTGAGFDGRLVRVEGSPLVRVRSGLFATREEADALAGRLTGAGFQVTVSVDADKERPAGR